MAEKTFGDTGKTITCDKNVYQQYEDTCAIQSQRLILEKFGIRKTQEELIEEAKINGWYAQGGGTQMEDVGKLLELHGIEVEISHDNNIFSLANELAQNHQVIVAVDSSELWERGNWNNSLKDFFTGDTPDHALIVSGLDTTDPENIQVVLTDPGTGEVRVRYSEEEFINAWKDSNCWMMTTETSPSEDLNTNFDLDYSFAGIHSDTLQHLAELVLPVTTEKFGSFIDNLLENPSISWEKHLGTIPELPGDDTIERSPDEIESSSIYENIDLPSDFTSFEESIFDSTIS